MILFNYHIKKSIKKYSIVIIIIKILLLLLIKGILV